MAVTFKGSVVERLTKTILIFWNNGTEVIDGKDIVASDPIEIAFYSGDNILSYRILKRTKDANKVIVDKSWLSDNALLLSLDYLDPNDGVVLEIIHDSEEKYPKITGTIKGLPKGFVDQGEVYENEATKIRKRRRMYSLTIAMGLAMLIIGFVPSDIFFTTKRPPSSALFIILGILYAGVPAFLLWFHRGKYPKQLEIVEIESHKAGQIP